MAGEAVWRATPEDENVGMDSNASGRRETCLSTERDGSGFTPEDLSFVDFSASLGTYELQQIKRTNYASDSIIYLNL